MTKSDEGAALPTFDIVVAVDRELGIGKGGDLPWRLRSEMAHFQRLTKKVERGGRRNAVFMGRRNWESIPDKYRPLRERLNVVLTRQENYVVSGEAEAVLRASSIEDCLGQLAKRTDIERIFCVGGGLVYRHAIQMPKCEHLYVTRINARYSCDTQFPSFDHLYEFDTVMLDGSDDGTSYQVQVWRRRSDVDGADRVDGIDE